MKQKRVLVNIIFAVVVLALAAALLVWRNSQNSGAALGAELIYGDNNTVTHFSLDQDATYDVDTGYYTVHIEI